MTINQFKKVKVGDFGYIPDQGNKLFVLGREILRINRSKKTLTLFMESRPLSYRYVQRLPKKRISNVAWTETKTETRTWTV